VLQKRVDGVACIAVCYSVLQQRVDGAACGADTCAIFLQANHFWGM